MSNRTGVTPGRGGFAAGFISELAAGPAFFIGKIETIAGACTLTRSDGIPVQVKLGDPVCQGDIIETAADGQVGIRFIDGTTFSLSNSARMLVKEFAGDETSPSARFDVTQGTFRFIAGETGNAGRFGVDTPFASIRGRTQSSGIGMLSLVVTPAMLGQALAQGTVWLRPPRSVQVQELAAATRVAAFACASRSRGSQPAKRWTGP